MLGKSSRVGIDFRIENQSSIRGLYVDRVWGELVELVPLSLDF